jgi:putative transposase
MASDLFRLDFLVIQIDGIHMDEDLILVTAIGVDATRPVPMPHQPR